MLFLFARQWWVILFMIALYFSGLLHISWDCAGLPAISLGSFHVFPGSVISPAISLVPRYFFGLLFLWVRSIFLGGGRVACYFFGFAPYFQGLDGFARSISALLQIS